jgi:hypothetical protein
MRIGWSCGKRQLTCPGKIWWEVTDYRDAGRGEAEILDQFFYKMPV